MDLSLHGNILRSLFLSLEIPGRKMWFAVQVFLQARFQPARIFSEICI